MKKQITWLLIAVSMMLLLTACSNPLAGTWNTTINGAEGQMILEKDGTGEVISNGISRPCTWEVEGDRLTVVQNVGGAPFVFLDNVTYTIEEDTLTIVSYDGSNSLVFEKK